MRISTGKNTDWMYKSIAERIDEEEALVQLAEECAELSQAALKMVRYHHDDTPVSYSDIKERLSEECADVVNCICVLKFFNSFDDDMCKYFSEAKTMRWLDRVRGKATQHEDSVWP